MEYADLLKQMQKTLRVSPRTSRICSAGLVTRKCLCLQKTERDAQLQALRTGTTEHGRPKFV